MRIAHLAIFGATVFAISACSGVDNSTSSDTGPAGSNTDAGGSADAGGRIVECDQWHAGQAAEIASFADGLSACAADGECVIVEIATGCLGGCPTALGAAKVEEFNAGRSGIEAKWCIYPYLNECDYKKATCGLEYRARCAAGKCLATDGPVVPDAGTTDVGDDAGIDAGLDTGADAGEPDAGPVDAGDADGGIDSGPDGGVKLHAGTIDDPIPLYISADTPLPLPFTYDDSRDTNDAVSDAIDAYTPNTVNESGPEFVYVFTVDREARVSVMIDSPEPSNTDIDVHLLSSVKPATLIDRDNLGVYAVLAPGKYFLSLDTYVNSSGTALKGPYHLRVVARARDTGASQYFNDYVLKAVDYLYANYRLLGYADKVLTHDIQYGKYGTIPMTGGGKSMCVSAVMETILTTFQVYEQETGDATVWDFLPKRSYEYLAATDIKAHIWVNADLDSYGTGDALAHFGMGELVPFEQLRPGSFININRSTGTGHAVTFISFIDDKGVESDTWHAAVVGFKYFSSQGSADVGVGGMDWRYAIFETPEYEANGYPAMPYLRDTHIIKSSNRKYLNTGMMFHPENWLPIGPKLLGKVAGPQVSFFDPVFFDGVTSDDR